jgi:hypothetical protein
MGELRFGLLRQEAQRAASAAVIYHEPVLEVS